MIRGFLCSQTINWGEQGSAPEVGRQTDKQRRKKQERKIVPRQKKKKNGQNAFIRASRKLWLLSISSFRVNIDADIISIHGPICLKYYDGE